MAQQSLARPFQRDPYRSLRLQDCFAELPNEVVENIAAQGRFVDLFAGTALRRSEQRAAVESFYLLVDGQISVISQRDPDPVSDTSLRDYLAWLRPGDFFSDAYQELRAPDAAPRIECVATVSSVLFELSRQLVENLFVRHRDWAQGVLRRNAVLRSHYKRHQQRARHMVQDFFIRHGYSFAGTMRVLQLDRCIDCDACEKSCADRHGAPRLSRHGPRLGQVAFPIACRTCIDARCVSACPFDAMKRDPDSGEVFVANNCVGCSGCAVACPNDAIRMIQVPYKSADFTRPMPFTKSGGETNVEGLYLVGEAAGDGLIKLAINNGKKAVDKICEAGLAAPSSSDRLDVIIVGAGPAGLSASLACREQGLRFKVFDKGDFAMTIQNYPRKKMVMAEPASIPLYGSLWLRDTTKEELIAKWNEIIESTGLQIESSQEVKKVEKLEPDLFEVTTAGGSHRARRVILATGNRGAPRTLGVDGEAAPRVQYTLTDPEVFVGKRCLVVGGGDSAVEAAMSLADVEGIQVAISYRRDRFGRIKPGNRLRLEEYEQDGLVEMIMSSTVQALEEGAVVLKTENGPRRLDNDVVFAMLGASPPTPFFQSAGIEIVEPETPEMEAYAQAKGLRHLASKCDHCKDYEDQACITACPTGAMQEIEPDEVFIAEAAELERPVFSEQAFMLGIEEHRAQRHGKRLPRIGLLSMLAMAGVGLEVFLRRTMPEESLLGHYYQWIGSAQQVTFESGSGMGHWLGVLGLGIMSLTLLYPLKSRFGYFASISGKAWMGLHMWVGFTGAAFATYHSLFKMDRWAALACWAMWLVVASGVIGRFLYGWVHRGIGLAEFERGILDVERRRLYDALESQSDRTQILKIGHLEIQPPSGGLLLSLPIMIYEEIRDSLSLVWVRFVGLRHISDRSLRRRTYRLRVEERSSQRTQRYLESAKKLLRLWTFLHLGLTLVMFAVAILHTVFALMYKAH